MWTRRGRVELRSSVILLVRFLKSPGLQQGVSQALMADRPIGRECCEFAEFHNRRSGVGMDQGGAKILTGIEPVRVEALRFPVFANCRNIIAFVAIRDA